MGLTGEGVEIGVYSAWHASLILNNWPGRMLYAVDPWAGPDEKEWAQRYTRAVSNLSKHKDRCTILKTDSLSASEIFDDGVLDWVYIDGRHDYDGVMEDIQVWTPKVKKGGVVAGHDYPSWDGVKKAVDEYFGSVLTWPEAQAWYIIQGYPDETGTRPIGA